MIPVIIRMNYKIAVFFIFIGSFVAVKSKAQVVELGLHVGGAGYMGDLNPTNPVKISGLSFGGLIRLNFDPNWALSFNYNYGRIKADDSKSPNPQFNQRNLSFYNNLHEFSTLVEFNFFDYFAGGGNGKFSPYVYTGIAGLIYNPKTKYKGAEYELALYNTEEVTYRTYALALPYGGGVKYNVSGSWSLTGNVGYRTAYTDYLDDVSGTYPGVGAFSNSDPSIRNIQIALSDRSGEVNGNYIGGTGVQRGDFRKRDNYMFVGIGITYTFVSQKCF